MMEECQLSEEQLFTFVIGEATEDVRIAVEQSPVCKAKAQQIADELSPLMSLLHRSTCPDEDMLIDYQEQLLDSTQYLVVHKHLEFCPLCRQEVAMLAAIDAVPVVFEPTQVSQMVRNATTQIVRRVVEAVFRSPLQRGFAGSNSRYYEAPQIIISVSTQKMQGKARTWSLLGQVLTPAGLPAGEMVEYITLRPLSQSKPEEYQAVGEEDGTFLFEALQSGTYRLSIITNFDEPVEIVIPEIRVGSTQ